MSFTVLDLETAPSAHGLAVPADADERAGLRSPWDKKCALNPRLGRIVAVGIKNGESIVAASCDEAKEKELIRFALESIDNPEKLVTFNGLGFDMPFLFVRAAVHGLRIPRSPNALLKRYSTEHHADLSALLLNWDRPEKGDSLHGWCKTFGVDVTDTTSGADIWQMVQANDEDGIRAHCASDLDLTYALALKMQTAGLFV